DPDGMMAIPGALKSGLLVQDTNFLGVSDISNGNMGSTAIGESIAPEQNNTAAYKGYFQQVSDYAANADESLGGGCPDGDCDEKDQTGNVANGISSTAKGIEINSQIHSESYTSKYGTKHLNKDQITKKVRENMKLTSKGAHWSGTFVTTTFGGIDIYNNIKNDGYKWGYNTNLAVGRFIGGTIGSYYGGKLGMEFGTGSGTPGPGTVAGGIIGAGFGGYFGSKLGEKFVNLFYKN